MPSLLVLLAALAGLFAMMQGHEQGLGPGGVVLIATAFFLIGALPGYLIMRQQAGGFARLLELAREIAAGKPARSAAPAGEKPFSELAQILQGAAERHEQTARQLREERNRIDLILRRMAEGVAVIEAGNKIVFCNEAFSQALGLAGLPRAGNLLVEVTRDTGLLEIVKKVAETGEVIRVEIQTGLSKPRTFDVTGAPIPTETTPSVVLVLHDVSEVRRLEQMRRDFVANVSHEFKTPLTAIQGFAETLLEGAITDKQNALRFLQIIKDHAIRLNRMTVDLLRLSQIEAGQVGIERASLPVAETLQACLDTVRMKAEKKKLALLAEFPAADCRTLADSAKLREIILNLLDNAIQYTPAGGTITLGAQRTAEGVTFFVRDTGIGIPVSEQQRIFERFYRVDEARSREVGGTGLGLAITKHLVEAHGGVIRVASGVNQGSTFSVFIPDAPSAAPELAHMEA